MEPVVFSMAGEVRGKGRPRFSTRGPFPKAYTDAKTKAYESSVKKIAAAAMGSRAPFSGPLSVAFRLRLQPPKSMSKRDRAAVLAGDTAYMGRVDVDNAAKALLDAMNKVVFGDDRQIVRLFVTKVAAENPGVDVRIEPLGEPA